MLRPALAYSLFFLSGIAALVYEFYEVGRRPKPGGQSWQWVTLHQIGPEELELISDSFASVFPDATLWWGQLDARYPIVALVGGKGPISLDPSRLNERMHAQDGLPGGADPDLRLPSALPALYLGGWEHDPAGPLNTDEHPRLEFTAPVSHRAGRALRGLELRRHFDGVFSRLPSTGRRFGEELGAQIRDAEWCRAPRQFSLFGNVNP